MQLYALDNSSLVLAANAARDRAYFCPECRGVVRIRGGGRRQTHFYHTRRPASCRQHGKSLAHLQIQLHLKSQIPTLELEKKLENRIADAHWPEEKIVFEIQCSPISLETAKARCLDYFQQGLTPVWVLHDRRYNRFRLSEAEEYLRKSTTTFFTDGTTFYDQFDVSVNLRRVYRGDKIGVDLSQPQKKPCEPLLDRRWPLSFRGDLSDHVQEQSLEHLKKLVKRCQKRHRKRFWKPLYRFLLYRLLEVCSLR